MTSAEQAAAQIRRGLRDHFETDAIARTLGTKTEALAAVRSRLQVALSELTLDEKVATH